MERNVRTSQLLITMFTKYWLYYTTLDLPFIPTISIHKYYRAGAFWIIL